MLHTFYNIRKTLDSSGFPVILPNPNRITLIALSDSREGDFVCSFPTFSPHANLLVH